ncbi:Nucleotide/sugar transporter family protein [Zea mays]|uniref:Nucleotide/sugar transporter family protein n=1 Tax=Zea mays TaxID=4577 RepID=A0A1D6HD30_MAIZE|nr:Nucleotide/sugar transporter family protein [Zea mays]
MECSFIKPSFAFGCLLATLLGLHLYSVVCVFLISSLTLNKHVQMVCSTCLLYVLRRLKIISFTNSDPSVPSDSLFFVPFRLLLRTTPLSLAYLLYMLASMESVRGVNVPMYTTLRRTTVVFTMTMEYFLAKQKHTPPIIGSVALIVFGAFVAGARDLSFDARGYAIVFVANITTAVYLATINRIGKSSGLNSFGLMWCNGLVCGPSVLFLTYIQGDLKRTMEFPYLHSLGFQVVLLFSCILAFLLNYTIFWNTILNSALTQSMCGNLKDFFTVGIGWVLFGGLPFDLLNVIGQGLGFLGSGLYAYCKIRGK